MCEVVDAPAHVVVVVVTAKLGCDKSVCEVVVAPAIATAPLLGPFEVTGICLLSYKKIYILSIQYPLLTH